MKPQVQDWQVASGQIADGLTLGQGKSWAGLFESRPLIPPSTWLCATFTWFLPLPGTSASPLGLDMKVLVKRTHFVVSFLQM